MPELPEVETTLSGIRPYLLGAAIRLVVRERRLRWPIPPGLEGRLRGRRVTGMYRRGKYLIAQLDSGALLMHLGMSGSFRVLPKSAAPESAAPGSAAPGSAAPGSADGRYWHDHYDLLNQRGDIVRYRDPRRFGCLLWCAGDPMQHPRILSLGVEPLAAGFDGAYLRRAAQSRRIAIKSLLMAGAVVVGVGNIYASEALFHAGIHPLRSCGRISAARCQRLTDSVRKILTEAIAAGGSTLRDFTGAHGELGYFKQQLHVYGRANLPCHRCDGRIRSCIIAQRSTFYCARCQR